MDTNNLYTWDFFTRHTDVVTHYLEAHYPFSYEQLKKYRKRFSWEHLASNEHLPWSFGFFKEFDYELTMREPHISQDEVNDYCIAAKLGHYYPGIYGGDKMPWTLEFIDFAKDKLTWFMISQYWKLDTSIEIFERYADYWNYFFIMDWKLNWSAELIRKYKDKWSYSDLCGSILNGRSQDPQLLSALEELAPEAFNHAMKIYRPEKSGYSSILRLERDLKKRDLLIMEEPWNEDQLMYALENFTINELVNCHQIKLTPGLIDYLSDRDGWKELFDNTEIPVTEQLIDKYLDRIPFAEIDDVVQCSFGISNNVLIPWSIRLIEKYKDYWSWTDLSNNYSIPRSDEMLEAFIDKWEWESLSYIWGDYWNMATISKFRDKVDWFCLSRNTKIDFTFDLIFAFEPDWDYEELLNNQTFLDKIMKPYLTDEFAAKVMEAL